MVNFDGLSDHQRPELVKTYNECFALAVLQHCFSDEFKNFVVKEALPLFGQEK